MCWGNVDISNVFIVTGDIYLCTKTGMYNNDVNNGDVFTHTRDIFMWKQFNTDDVFIPTNDMHVFLRCQHDLFKQFQT